MRFLILSITAGQGHHQCAKALSESLIKKGHECEIMDTYKHTYPALGETIDKGYLLSTRYMPEIYGRIYQIADEKGIGSGLTKETQKLVYKKLVDSINYYNPDCIICTHVFPGICISYAEKRGKLRHIPSVGIVTDFTVHPYWQKTALSAYVVPSGLLGYQCMVIIIPEDKVYPLGIPISEKFSEKLSKTEARSKLSIHHKDTVLVMTGSMGFGNVPKLIREIDEVDHDFQILCVCGNNKKNYEEISTQRYRHGVYAYGFVDNISDMMDASDFIVTKPGGLSVSESLAKELPMILVDPIPGQETRNREFLLNSGLAMAVTRTFSVGEAVYQMYKSRPRFEGENTLTSIFRRPNSAKDVADLAIRLADESK